MAENIKFLEREIQADQLKLEQYAAQRKRVNKNMAKTSYAALKPVTVEKISEEAKREQMKRRKPQILSPPRSIKDNVISADQTHRSLTSIIKGTSKTDERLPIQRKMKFEDKNYEPIPKRRDSKILSQCPREDRTCQSTTVASPSAAGLPELAEDEKYYYPKQPKKRISHFLTQCPRENPVRPSQSTTSAYSGAAGLPVLNDSAFKSHTKKSQLYDNGAEEKYYKPIQKKRRMY